MLTTSKEQRKASKAEAVTFNPGSYGVESQADQFMSSTNPNLIMVWGKAESGKCPLNVGKMPEICFTDKGAVKHCVITVTKKGDYTVNLK